MEFTEKSELISAGYVKVWALLEPVVEGQEVKVDNKKYPEKSYKFTFSDIGDIYNAIKQLLENENIAVMHDTKTENGMNYVNTILIHSSGERITSGYIGFPIIMDRKYDFNNNVYDTVSIKDNGGGITSYRRYSLINLFGITTIKKNDIQPKTTKTGVTSQPSPGKRDFSKSPDKAQSDRHPSLVSLKQVSDIETLFAAIASTQGGTKKDVWEAIQGMFPTLQGVDYRKLTRQNADILLGILQEKYSAGVSIYVKQ